MWIRTETVKNRDARIGLAFFSGWGKSERADGTDAKNKKHSKCSAATSLEEVMGFPLPDPASWKAVDFRKITNSKEKGRSVDAGLREPGEAGNPPCPTLPLGR